MFLNRIGWLFRCSSSTIDPSEQKIVYCCYSNILSTLSDTLRSLSVPWEGTAFYTHNGWFLFDSKCYEEDFDIKEKEKKKMAAQRVFYL